MKAYSTDLRERVVAACDAGGATREQTAARFSVSVVWIRKQLRRRRDWPWFESRLTYANAVRADVDATLEDLAQASGVACCPSAVHRALARLGITRKKSRGGRPSETVRG